jgi:hypothetical protein
MLDRLLPDPKCRHDRVRGTCTICNGLRPEPSVPTGTFRGCSGGRLKAKQRKR